MEFLLGIIIIVESVAIALLWRERFQLKEELGHLNHKYNHMKITMARNQVHSHEGKEQLDTFGTYDKVVKMHRSGESAEVISERLKIPLNKVEMTLKFEKMKKDGAL
jgi:hypothetical protein